MKRVFLVLSLIGMCTLYSADKPIKQVKYLTPGRELEVLGVSNTVVPMDLASAIKELVTGITDPYFGEELFNKISEMQKKTSSGEYIEHWDNGQLKVKGTFKNGCADGHIHGWYKDGRDAFKAFFYEGKKAGIHIAFYPEEFARSIECLGRILSYNGEGRLDGEQTTFYSDSLLHASIRFKNGLLHGKTVAYIRDSSCRRPNPGEHTVYEWLYKKGKLIEKKPPLSEIAVQERDNFSNTKKNASDYLFLSMAVQQMSRINLETQTVFLNTESINKKAYSDLSEEQKQLFKKNLIILSLGEIERPSKKHALEMVYIH